MIRRHRDSQHLHEEGDALTKAVQAKIESGFQLEASGFDAAWMSRERSSGHRFLLCLLFWWPGFFFGHHNGKERIAICTDHNGELLEFRITENKGIRLDHDTSGANSLSADRLAAERVEDSLRRAAERE